MVDLIPAVDGQEVEARLLHGGAPRRPADAADLRALRFVLQRMDELDDAMRVRGEEGKGAVKTRAAQMPH